MSQIRYVLKQGNSCHDSLEPDQLDSFLPKMFDLVVFPCPKQSQLHEQSKGQMNLNDFFSRSNERYLESNIRLENNLWS